MVWAAAGNLPEQNKNNKCVNRPPGTAVKKYAGTYDLPCTIVPDHIPEQHAASQMQNPYLDNSHTIEVAMKDITVRISNEADPVLLTRTFRLLQELSC